MGNTIARIRLNNRKLSEFPSKRHMRESITKGAKTVCSNRIQKCQKCGYDKHVEVCHKKQVCEFPPDATVGEVNHPDNLILLCPNCHYELDHPQPNKRICKCRRWKALNAKTCQKCFIKSVTRKPPSRKKLFELLQKNPMSKVGTILNIDRDTIKRWANQYGITPRPQAYWMKKNPIPQDARGKFIKKNHNISILS